MFLTLPAIVIQLDLLKYIENEVAEAGGTPNVERFLHYISAWGTD